MPYARHATLTANTVATYTLNLADNASGFEVVQRTALADLYVSYDGTAAPANPTVGGNDFDVVPAAVGAWIRRKRTGTANIVVKVISSAASQITIRAIQ